MVGSSHLVSPFPWLAHQHLQVCWCWDSVVLLFPCWGIPSFAIWDVVYDIFISSYLIYFYNYLKNKCHCLQKRIQIDGINTVERYLDCWGIIHSTCHQHDTLHLASVDESLVCLMDVPLSTVWMSGWLWKEGLRMCGVITPHPHMFSWCGA